MNRSTVIPDPFSARAWLTVGDDKWAYYRLERVHSGDLARIPMTVKVLLENVLRNAGRGVVREDEVSALAAWQPRSGAEAEIPFLPARVLMQDFTGVPAVVDLAAMRDAVAAMGGDPALINPLVPADLVIDHSVQVDRYNSPDAFAFNVDREYERNGERYELLRWAQTAFDGLRVVPPGTGIVHQVNLEFLAQVVVSRNDVDGQPLALPDTLVGTDSHTTMVNGLGVLGYGVGGIEAEAVLLGQPLYQPLPRVVGVRLFGDLPRGSTATDLVLVVSNMLRAHGVVGSFVEFAGDGLGSLALADRATISNMSPEYGATAALFPIDDETLAYLRQTGRPAGHIALVERYAKENGLWREPGAGPDFDEALELDLSTVEPTLAGPRRPQDKVRLPELGTNFHESFTRTDFDRAPVTVAVGGASSAINHGSVVIAAITSCTNTSNPTVMIGAALLARNALARGLTVKPYVKTSMAPGSRAVTEYLKVAGLLDSLDQLGFGVVGYGCTTCIGNSGPLDDAVAAAIEENQLITVAVLSGNRNFEGRIHPLARASYLASPPLVVAFALAGTVDIDLTQEPLGTDRQGKPVFLADIWPTGEEIRRTIGESVSPGIFERIYSSVFAGDERWTGLPVPVGTSRYAWDTASTYVAHPPFFAGLGAESEPVKEIVGARVLALLGDSVTTDHISPAGTIPPWSPAGSWLQERGVSPLQFNSYGARRGHHEVMMRGTFGNIRLRNQLVEREGPYTAHQPSGEEMFIYDASVRYRSEAVPLLVIAGREYGSGSSRDWAAKGTALLGVRAVLAQSFERIHRSNLVGMGVLPLEFLPGQSAEQLELTGREEFDIVGLAGGLRPRQAATLVVREGQRERRIEVICRLDGPIEIGYYRNGGILPAVLRRLAGPSVAAPTS
jgi:aconitate hydratase